MEKQAYRLFAHIGSGLYHAIYRYMYTGIAG